MYAEYARMAAWGMDMCRALRDRPWICRVLIRIIFGKYAYREFVGLVHEVIRSSAGINIGYGLEQCDYHADEVHLDWWNYKDHGYGTYDILPLIGSDES